MDHDGDNPGHRPETERNHEDQRKHDVRNGTAELHQATNRKPQPWRRRGIFSGEKIEPKSEDRSGQGTDVTDQDGLAEQRQPFFPAPEPLADIGPDPRAALQRTDAVEVADEISDL